jgi:hypothetical protein
LFRETLETTDYALRTLKFFLEIADEHQRTKETNFLCADMLPVLFTAFTTEDIGQKGRE